MVVPKAFLLSIDDNVVSPTIVLLMLLWTAVFTENVATLVFLAFTVKC